MRIRTMAGLALAATATAGAIAGGVAYAADEDGEPIVRIVEREAPAENAENAENAALQEQQQPREDCPDKAQPSQDGL